MMQTQTGRALAFDSNFDGNFERHATSVSTAALAGWRPAAESYLGGDLASRNADVAGWHY
jgi:hypothetical protein